MIFCFGKCYKTFLYVTDKWARVFVSSQSSLTFASKGSFRCPSKNILIRDKHSSLFVIDGEKGFIKLPPMGQFLFFLLVIIRPANLFVSVSESKQQYKSWVVVINKFTTVIYNQYKISNVGVMCQSNFYEIDNFDIARFAVTK